MTTAETPDDGPILLRTDEDGIATLTLNRPGSGNSLSHALVAELSTALARIADDRDIRVVVLAANGRHFCTGHDLKESVATRTGSEKLASNLDCNAMMQAIVALPQPVIAKVQGTATASGCELMASCDLAVAAQSARFATPGVNIGFWCYTPQVALSRAVSRKHALEMLLTGELYGSDEARRMGLANRGVPDGELDEAVSMLSVAIASKSAAAVSRGKRSFHAQYDLDRADAYAHVEAVIPEAFETEDTKEGIAAFLEKRPPRWKGR